MLESGKLSHSSSVLCSVPHPHLKKIRNTENVHIPNIYLKSALAYLRHNRKCRNNKLQTRAKKYCWPTKPRNKNDVILESYQMLFFVRTIRNAILCHNWETALDLLLLLLEKGKKYYTKYFVKSCLPIAFHHPHSTPDFLYSFFETVTGYVEDKEIESFILLLFRIRENIRPGAVKHRRKHIKLIADPRFSLDTVEPSTDEE